MSTSSLGVVIRTFKSWGEYLAAEELQRKVWQMPDWRDAVPANLLVAAHKGGAIVLGAFDADETLVGFVFSFIGREVRQGTPIFKHCSHMLAVLPEIQSRKVGTQLKLKQRELALAQGIDLITWTFDPLLAVNAHINLVRLGSLARRYIPDAYGDMTDGLNAGLPSDRFEVDWWLKAPRVCQRIENAVTRSDWNVLVQSGAQSVLQVAIDARGLPHIDVETEPLRDPLLVEIPADLGALKVAAPALVQEWRLRTRDIFQRAFAAGYAAVDFVTTTREGHRRAAYVLTRQPLALGDS